MRWFLIPAIATAALALADPAPAKAQILVRGYPTYSPPYIVRFAPYNRVPTAASPSVLPNFNGGLVDVALDNSLRTLGSTGYGPYAGNSALFAAPRYYGVVNPANYGPWGAYRPYTAPATNWKWVDPRQQSRPAQGLVQRWKQGRRKSWWQGHRQGPLSPTRETNFAAPPAPTGGSFLALPRIRGRRWCWALTLRSWAPAGRLLRSQSLAPCAALISTHYELSNSSKRVLP